MAHQIAVTVCAQVRTDSNSIIAEPSGDFGSGNGVGIRFRWAGLPSVHFARLVQLDETTDLDGNVIAASLVYMADVDVSIRRHLRDLIAQSRGAVDEVFGRCVGYPVQPTDETRLAWLTAHHVRPAAYYVHRVGRTARQIYDEANLRYDLERAADAEQGEDLDSSAGLVFARLRERVLGRAANAWARRRARGVDLLFRATETLHMIAVPAILILAAPIAIPIAVVGILVIRAKERTDQPEAGQVDFAHIEAVRAYEDFGAQNPLTAVGLVKPGLVRKVSMRVGLMGLDYANRHVFNRDNLAGVRSIHFARWVPLDDGRRLIFASSYDGSAESYMDDFINQLHWGINLIFSNGVGFPRTTWLVRGGAQDELAYKNFLGRHQVPTPVFYSAYPELTAVAVDTNSALRDGLTESLDDLGAQQWLASL
jgi:hypothetical protein